jgi:N-carbamoylputrescine amidase
VGKEEEMDFYGQSFISDPFGEILSRAGNEDEILYADCNFNKIKEARELLHFLRDRRVDTYQPLLQRILG